MAWSQAERKPIRKTFPTLAAAKAWRADAQVAIRQGLLQAGGNITVRDVAEAWVEGARAGTVLNRSGEPYKPSVVRGYETHLRLRILPDLGARKLSSVTRRDVQRIVDRLVADRVDASTVRNALLPLRVLYRRALVRGEVAMNPCSGLELPAVRGRRDRVAAPGEVRALLAALPEQDRVIWALALYAGLRRGEIQALTWADIDTDRNLIHVHHAWDRYEGRTEPKTRAGRRTVPLITPLRLLLLEHRLRTGHPTHGLLFEIRPGRPFDPSTLLDRARKHWTAAGLTPIGLHECRHTYASLMIAAEVNLKALSTYLGHASITITLDRYGHLLPGNETQAAHRLETLLAAG